MPRKKNPDDEVLTRGVFKKELKEELKVALAAFGKELRQEMRLETRELLVDFYHSLVEPRFLKIEGELGGLRGEFGGLRDEFGGLRGEFDGLRGEFDDFRSETLGRFDDLYKKFEDLRQEYVFTNHQLKGIDFRLERLEKQNKPSPH
jgi:hypothetical protein